MKYLKKYKLFESTWMDALNIKSEIDDMLIELRHEGLFAQIYFISLSYDIMEVTISKKGTMGKHDVRHLSFWKEIKDVIYRIIEYSNGSSVKFYADGVEFGVGCKSEQDFSGITDEFCFWNFRMIINI